MRKKVIIELEDDDFRSVMGAILKTGADFQVLSLDKEPEPKPQKAVQRKDASGMSARDRLLAFMTAQNDNKIQWGDLPTLARSSGFAVPTLQIKLRELIKEGAAIQTGNYIKLKAVDLISKTG